MPYITTLGKQTYRVDIAAPQERGQQHVSVDGRSYTVDWQQIAPLATDGQNLSGTGGRYSLILAGTSYEVFARRISASEEKTSATYEIVLKGQRFEVHVEDERLHVLAELIHVGPDTSEAMVTAPMPGLVVALPLEPGATVTQGQTVAVLEAMKMENDLTSPISGTLKEVRVTAGQTVDQGTVLVVVAGA